MAETLVIMNAHKHSVPCLITNVVIKSVTDICASSLAKAETFTCKLSYLDFYFCLAFLSLVSCSRGWPCAPVCPPSPGCYDNRYGPLCLARLSVFFLASEFCVYFGQQSFTCCGLQRSLHNLQLFHSLLKFLICVCVCCSLCVAHVWGSEGKL